MFHNMRSGVMLILFQSIINHRCLDFDILQFNENAIYVLI